MFDAIAWKLSVHSDEWAEEGKRLVSSMLEHLQVEFKWEKIITILESAADIARSEKENAYQRAKSFQFELRNVRRKLVDA